MIGEKLQRAGIEPRREAFKEQAPKQPQQYANGQEEAGLAGDLALTIGGDTATRRNMCDT